MVDGLHGKNGLVVHTIVEVELNKGNVTVLHQLLLMEDKAAMGQQSTQFLVISNTVQVIEICCIYYLLLNI